MKIYLKFLICFLFKVFSCNCGGCQTVTRELVTLAYFSVCFRQTFVTQASSEASACVGDRLTPPT